MAAFDEVLAGSRNMYMIRNRDAMSRRDEYDNELSTQTTSSQYIIQLPRGAAPQLNALNRALWVNNIFDRLRTFSQEKYLTQFGREEKRGVHSRNPLITVMVPVYHLVCM